VRTVEKNFTLKNLQSNFGSLANTKNKTEIWSTDVKLRVMTS